MVKQYDYDSMAEYYDILDGSIIPYNELSAELIKKISVKGKKAIDLACGTGNFTYALKKLNYSIKGSDLSSKMISIAKTKFPDITFYKKDMTLPLNKKYDVVFCMFNSIAHCLRQGYSQTLVCRGIALLSP
ncbi:MAG: methyltransferase domain-containing protein [Nanoarchaeota archaeon]|nr:methyltransferase domain-containing protein [Nanoarchaeota archaeon]MBU1598064.1 methyltransferase domain-containing protein [Nanoarchaeota archaeon]MBU2441644.1 methyltransferase domain-containing protein [Nanoarchaeota archaeon]